MREVIMTGKTVEEATELACIELGLSREEISVEIIDMPQKKLFKTIPAKIKATADVDDVTPIVKKEEPKKAVSAAPAPASTQAPAKAEYTPAKKVDLGEDEKASLAVNYLKEVCENMGIAGLNITAETRGEALILNVEGPSVGALIGRRGETMEALSYLCSLVANRAGGDYTKIGIDVAGYRSKRESDLEQLAKRIADKVVKTNRAQVLEPMNPYERRIIHSAISEVEGVKSESTGEGMARRVVVLSTAPNAKNDRPERYDKSGAPRKNDRGPSSKPRGDFNRNSQSRPSGERSGYQGSKPRQERASSTPARNFANRPQTGDAPVAPTRTETINDGANTPLYGKIEI